MGDEATMDDFRLRLKTLESRVSRRGESTDHQPAIGFGRIVRP
jgi:hypothetical protein